MDRAVLWAPDETLVLLGAGRCPRGGGWAAKSVPFPELSAVFSWCVSLATTPLNVLPVIESNWFRSGYLHAEALCSITTPHAFPHFCF